MSVGDETRSELLRPAVDFVIAEARKQRGDVPASVLKVLSFRRMPDSARARIERAVDSDDGFRESMAAAAKASEVEPAGMLWLTRPDGWEHELAQLVADAERRASILADVREEDEHERREANARTVLEAVQAELGEEREISEQLRVALAEERLARRVAAEEVDRLTEEGERLESERRRAVRELKHTERLLARSVEQRRALEAAAEPAAEATRDGVASSDGLVEAEPFVDDGAAQRSRRRTPIRLSGGVWDDSPEAMKELLDAANVVLVLDGYNVSMRRWKRHPIEQQRELVESAVGNVAARAGCSVIVVWDGADGMSPPVADRYRGVSVLFTPVDQEADDWIIDYCRSTPADTPLIVASDDERVRQGARSAGANVVTAEQILDYARS